MASPAVWFQNNDMLVTLSGLRTSTMASTAYLNGSTNVRLSVWSSQSTVGTPIVSAQSMPYVAGTNGNYRTVVQSTQHNMTYGRSGLARITLSHLGITGEWFAVFFVEHRRAT